MRKIQIDLNRERYYMQSKRKSKTGRECVREIGKEGNTEEGTKRKRRIATDRKKGKI